MAWCPGSEKQPSISAGSRDQEDAPGAFGLAANVQRGLVSGMLLGRKSTSRYLTGGDPAWFFMATSD